MLGERDEAKRRVHDRKMILSDYPIRVLKNVLEELSSSKGESGEMVRGSPGRSRGGKFVR
jgi:hypothetical protein